MTPTQVLRTIVDYREKDDYVGFKTFIESLEFDEILRLKVFARELKILCDTHLSELL